MSGIQGGHRALLFLRVGASVCVLVFLFSVLSMADDEQTGIGIALGSSSVFGIAASWLTADTNGDGLEDLVGEIFGTTLYGRSDEDSLIYSVADEDEDGTWLIDFATSHGEIQVKMSSAMSGESDLFKYEFTNQSYDEGGHGITSVAIPVPGKLSRDMVEVLDHPDTWEVKHTLGFLGGFITFSIMLDGTEIGVGETAKVGLALPHAADPEGEETHRDISPPPGFLVGGANPIDVGLISVSEEDDPDSPVYDWLQALLNGDDEMSYSAAPPESAGCREWMPYYLLLPPGPGLCIRGYMGIVLEKIALGLRVESDQEPGQTAPVHEGLPVTLALPLHPGTTTFPDPPLPDGWSLTAPERPVVSPGLAVFEGAPSESGLDEPVGGFSLLLLFPALVEMRTYRVSVVERGTSQPIQGATVTLGAHSRITGDDGTCRFDVTPGRYPVTISAPGYDSVSGTMTVSRDAENRETISLQRLATGRIYGAVLSATGVSKPDVPVYLDGEFSVKTDENGLFGFLAAVGVHTVTAGTPSAGGASAQQVTITEGGLHQVLLLAD